MAAGRVEEKLPKRQNAWSRDTVRLASAAEEYAARGATELGSGRSVWFRHRRIHDAIRVSNGHPGVFSPREIDDRLLAVGGPASHPRTRSPQILLFLSVTLVRYIAQESGRKLDHIKVVNRSLDLMLAALVIRPDV